MATAPRRSALRLTATLAILAAMSAVILGFGGAASAKSNGNGHRVTHSGNEHRVTPRSMIQVPALRGLVLLLGGLIHTLDTTVAALGTTVDNTGRLLGGTVDNTTTVLTTTLTRTTNNLTTVVTGLLGTNRTTSTPTPPPTSPPSRPTSRPAPPPTSSAAAPTSPTSAQSLGVEPSGVPSAVGSTTSVAPSSSPSKQHPDTETTASRLLRSVSMLALVGMTGALAFGVSAIVFGAGRRGRRAG